MFGLFERRSRRRERLRAEPFPEAWESILRKNVPLAQRLSREDLRELRGLIRVFLDEKRFEGCAGLELNDEIRVTIAAQACILLLHLGGEIYPRLVSILVYPSTYVAHARQPIGGGAVLEGEVARLGEAWQDGVVVLAWDDVLSGALDLQDGHNVVLHEFAHQLDQQDGEANGAPILGQRSRYVTWARVLGAEYDRLRREAGLGIPGVLDAYGANNPAEFFAVATECFFERPARLRREHPELFEELKGYYRQDPEQLLGTDPGTTAR